MTRTPRETTRGHLNQRDLNKIATAEKVRLAAAALFGEVGYEATTIRMIAKRAGMSTGAVFANYADKADLWKSIYGAAPIPPEVAHRMAVCLRGFTRNKGNMALAENCHPGARGAMEALFDIADELVDATIGETERPDVG